MPTIAPTVPPDSAARPSCPTGEGASLGAPQRLQSPGPRYFIAAHVPVTVEGAPYFACTTRAVPSADTITVKRSS